MAGTLYQWHPLPVCSVWTQEGYKPQNIVVLGDSAGGGMAVAVAIALKREGGS